MLHDRDKSYDLVRDILSMRLITALLIIMVVGSLFVCGCTRQTSDGTSSDAAGSAKPVTSSSAMPVESMGQYPAPPADNAVSAQINDKDLTDKSISVFFSGGKGQKMVRDSWIIISRSDGVTERIPLTPKAQSEVVLTGSEGEDLIRVYAEYYDGNIYQIAEKTVKMRQRV